MLKIGDFSKLSQVSIKALRYYDKMGLLKPLEVDGVTGYRYYSVSQLSRLNRILALKDLGLSLEQIAQVLDEGISAEQLHGMLRYKRAELQRHIADEQARLLRVEARLHDIATEDNLPYPDVVLKQVDAQLVAGRRDLLPAYPSVGRLLSQVFTYLTHLGVDGSMLTSAAIWHDDDYVEGHIDGEAIVYLDQMIPASRQIQVYELPGALMASLIHHGSYATFNRSYEAIAHWIEANNYRFAGPNREIYLYCSHPVRQDDESYVTEIQFPVLKKDL